MGLYCDAENIFDAKQAFVDDFNFQFIELLQGISCRLLWLFQVAAQSLLLLLLPTKYIHPFMGVCNSNFVLESALVSVQVVATDS